MFDWLNALKLTKAVGLPSSKRSFYRDPNFNGCSTYFERINLA